MPHFGLIGRRLAHSYSKVYFEEKFRALGLQDCHYDLYETENIGTIRDFLKRHPLDGFNVTIPYKEAIVPQLDDMDPVAREIGAVNVVKVHRAADASLCLVGYNTDAPAFRDSLLPLLQQWHREALILGTGGAAKAVAWALRRCGVAYRFVSRSPEGQGRMGYADAWRAARQALLIVNATPVGMYPDVGDTPWQHPEVLTAKHLCYDLIYNPSATRFLREAALQGATVQNGLDMLHRQADLAFDIFFAPKP